MSSMHGVMTKVSFSIDRYLIVEIIQIHLHRIFTMYFKNVCIYLLYNRFFFIGILIIRTRGWD